jgi:hypothetical protein
MKRTIASVLAIGACALVLSAFSIGGAQPLARSTQTAKLLLSSDCTVFSRSHPSASVTASGGYVMVSIAGPNEAMYTMAQARKLHPKTGEIMVSGQMMGRGGSSMSMGSTSVMRHIEVHICSKATGKAVVGAHPAMNLRDLSRGSMLAIVRVAEMQGLNRDPADTHYGNNLTVIPGHRYQLQTTINGQTGMFQFVAPKA